MTKEEFEKIVKEGIARIPEKFLKKLDNVDIIIEDEPNLSQLRRLSSSVKTTKDKKSRGIRLFGLYQGIPQTKRHHYGQVLPDKITIFKKPIEEIASSEAEAKRTSSLLHLHPATRESVIKEIVKNTVWHEIAHHFGMDEKQVRKAEYYRKIKKVP